MTPTDRVVPLASQSRWGQAGERSALLLQHARTTRHQVAWYFKAAYRQAGLRFFVWPNGSGTVLESIVLAPAELVRGDLLFESPTRLWDEGTYALVIGYDAREAVLPIELR